MIHASDCGDSPSPSRKHQSLRGLAAIVGNLPQSQLTWLLIGSNFDVRQPAVAASRLLTASPDDDSYSLSLEILISHRATTVGELERSRGERASRDAPRTSR